MRLVGDRPYLYQWELNKKLEVQEGCTKVHFDNGTTAKALTVEVTDGVANIPNILLQTAADLHCYAWQDGTVLEHLVIGVTARTKPEEYAYTETEVCEYSKLLEELKNQGAYYIPELDSEGNLRWSKSIDKMPDVTHSVNIRGPQGEKGEKGDTGAQGPRGEKGDKGDPGYGGIDPLIVTFDAQDSERVTHTALQIHQHAEAGGDVWFEEHGTRIALTKRTPKFAEFSTIGINCSVQAFIVYDDGTYDYLEDTLAFADEAAKIDDTTVGSDAWSSKNIVDKLCPPFEESGIVVTCEPFEGYPLNVTTDMGYASYTGATIVHSGKNMFPPKLMNTEAAGITGEYNPITGGFYVYGTATRDAVITSEPFLLPPGTYTVSAGYSGNPNCYIQVRNADTTPNTTIVTKVGNTGESKSFTLSEYTNIRIRFFVNGGTTVHQNIYPMIELGNQATEFEPYRGVRYDVDFGQDYNCHEFNWNTGRLHADEGYRYFGSHNFPAFPGVNILYSEQPDASTRVSGRADPVKIIEKLTHAIISLGGNV